MHALYLIVNIDVKTMEHLIFEFKHEIQSTNVHTNILLTIYTFYMHGKSIRK